MHVRTYALVHESFLYTSTVANVDILFKIDIPLFQYI